MKIKFLRSLLAGLAVAIGAGFAQAGPIIIAGTDADDHGSVSGGANLNGWKFMQQAFENLGGGVSNSNKTVVCLGCNGSTAGSAFSSAFGLSSLVVSSGWTSVALTSASDITNFFNGTGTTNVSNAGIIYMPADSSDTGGGITNAQLAPVNANGTAINNFVAGGGGLFTQTQGASSIGYGWLTALLPGLNFHTNPANSSTLTLTAAGNSAFPALTNADITNATPWHTWFDGSLGGLSVLVDSPAGAGARQAVVIGGGGGTVIVCGGPNGPPCPTPEPSQLPLLALGGAALLLSQMRKRNS